MAGLYDGSEESADKSIIQLLDYSEIISDWSHMVANKMFSQVEREEWGQWMDVSQEISFELRRVMETTAVGSVAKDIVYRQVNLMKSLPIEAAGRVREIQNRAIHATITGERPDQLYAMIMQSGDVAASRARMIARTEIGRATGALTQSRAQSIGSEGYHWRIEGVGTRPSHRRMKDKFVRWNNPPTLDGMTGHAGCLPNCQCWMEVDVPKPGT